MKKWGKVSVDCLFKDLAKKEWLEDVRKSVFRSVSPSLCVCHWEAEPNHFLVVRQEYVKKFNRDGKGLA